MAARKQIGKIFPRNKTTLGPRWALFSGARGAKKKILRAFRLGHKYILNTREKCSKREAFLILAVKFLYTAPRPQGVLSSRDMVHQRQCNGILNAHIELFGVCYARGEMKHAEPK